MLMRQGDALRIGNEIAETGRKLDEAEHTAQAVSTYSMACDYFMHAYTADTSPGKKRIGDILRAYLDRAEQLKAIALARGTEIKSTLQRTHIPAAAAEPPRTFVQCAACHQPAEVYLLALNNAWHYGCLKCAECFAGFGPIDKYVEVEGRAYHVECSEGATGLTKTVSKNITMLPASKSIVFTVTINKRLFYPGDIIKLTYRIENPTPRKVTHVKIGLLFIQTRMNGSNSNLKCSCS
jgi:hypothetical protein